MATRRTQEPSGPQRGCAAPCITYSGARCWKLALLTIVSLVLAQMYLYHNGSSFFDAQRLSFLTSSTLRFNWFRNYSVPEHLPHSTINSLSLERGSAAAPFQTTRGGNTDHPCPLNPPNLLGRLQVNKNPPSLEEQERAHPELTVGGHYRPVKCTARHKVAIIIPYRNRESHLLALVHHMHPFLQRQQLEYNIYVVEQAGNDSFNKGMLMNVGVLEALKEYAFDCLVLHDVDLLPEDDRNLYTCAEPPRHMSVAISNLQYKLPYKTYFGGVTAMTTKQYFAINGFSNDFWGWGGEDDDLFNRIRKHRLRVSRYPSPLGRYTMLSHKKEEPSPDRFIKIYQGIQKFKEGLNSTKYKIMKTERQRLFTWFFVVLPRS